MDEVLILKRLGVSSIPKKFVPPIPVIWSRLDFGWVNLNMDGSTKGAPRLATT